MLTNIRFNSLPRLSSKGGVLPFIEMSYLADIGQLSLEKARMTFYVARNQCEGIYAGFMAVQSPRDSCPNFSQFTSVSYLPGTVIMHGAFLAVWL